MVQIKQPIMKILLIISACFIISCNSGKNNEAAETDKNENSGKADGKWSNEEQVNFMDDCISKAGPAMKSDSAQIYCACMLTKAQTAYPKYVDVEKKMTIEQVNSWADECLGK